MNVRLNESLGPAKRVRPASALGVLFGFFATGSAFAELATPEQKRACTPDVYRLCAGEAALALKIMLPAELELLNVIVPGPLLLMLLLPAVVELLN
jgi:hypothetical protein